MSASLVKRLRAARQSWVELEAPKDGVPSTKRVLILRPLEADMQDFISSEQETEVDRMVRCACKYVIGWEGVTEADLLGPALASPEPVPFSDEVWREAVCDNREWLLQVALGLMAAVTAYEKRRAESSKNS